MYNYQTQRPNLFTEDGQVMFIKIMDEARRLLKLSGAVMSGNLISVCVGDTWLMLACRDRRNEGNNHPRSSGRPA